MKAKATLFIFFFMQSLLIAQAPDAFNYQGIARDLLGNPKANQNIGLQISVLNDSISGTSVYQETHSPTTNNLGLFSVKIGEGTSVNGEFSTIDWGDSEYFLQIEMDENGGSDYELIGINKLVSVPYALYANNGSKWKDVDGGIQYEEHVNIGNLVPTFFEYDLNIRKNQVGVPAGVQILNSNPGGRSITLLGEGNLQRYIYMTYLNSQYSPQFSAFQPESGVIYTGGNNGFKLISNNGPIRFTTGGLSASDESMVIEENGNVGVGTQNPNAKLQVNDGDIYIEDVNAGVIMKAPNGNCWRMTVSNDGQPVFNAVTCPN